MNIGIDIDDTICNTYEIFLPYLKKYMEEELGREYYFDLNDKSDYYKLVKRFGITEDEDSKFWEKYFPCIIEDVVPKSNSVEVIKKIKEEGNKIFLITARYAVEGYDVEGKTREWLEKNNILYDKLIINSHNKLEIAERENIDIFIDDSIRNCSMLLEGNIKTYMYTTEYNEFFKNEKLNRVYSWNEFYEMIKEEM